MRVPSTKHRLPLVATAFVVLLALGAIGLVNGSWAEQLSVNGTVQTAEIQVKWIAPTPTCGDHETKDIATTTRGLENNKLFVQVDNGYPGYVAKCNWILQNNGKLPVEVGSLDIKPGTGLTGCGVERLGQSVTLDCLQLKVTYIDGLGLQLDQGFQTASIANIEVKKGAAQGAKYGFEIQVCIQPFNIDQCPDKVAHSHE